MKNKQNFPETEDIAKVPLGHIAEQHKTAFDMVNAYGTYEIQPTADTDNMYPCIAQGFSENMIKTDRQNKHYKGDKFEKTKSNTNS